MSLASEKNQPHKYEKHEILYGKQMAKRNIHENSMHFALQREKDSGFTMEIVKTHVILRNDFCDMRD